MDSERTTRSLPAGWTFFRQWLKNPLRVAAISPSSRQLARQMMTQLPRNCRRVIELGGGTGVFTQALIDHGIGGRTAGARTQRGTAPAPGAAVPACEGGVRRRRQPARDRREHGFDGEQRADAIISGLGLLSMPGRRSRRSCRPPSTACARRPLIQFTYGPANPVMREVLEALELSSRRASFTWWNVPPATVYVYQRRVRAA
jgi:phospholipid N-methyltransferase